jgi:glycosyltransferase involved in cell wall biosynthesis
LKILFYNHTGQVSGAERVLLMILKGLDHQVCDAVVLCPADGRLTEMIGEMGSRIIHINSLTARFTWRVDHLVKYLASFVGVIRAARSIVLREAPDFVHANSIRAGLVMSAATAGLKIPVIWHAHDVLPRHPLSTVVRLFAAATSRNHILAVSQAAADRFQGARIRWLGRRIRVKVIHNAVDSERFQPNSESRCEIRRALGISEKARAIGIVGHLTPNKGQLELIEAFAAVSRENPDAVLLIIGESLFNRGTDYVKSLTSAATSFAITDRVRFLGPRDDMPELMRGLDLLVVNSLTEAFPLTVLEGMASETPVLTSAAGGTLEMIRHLENGWLVASRDRDALIDGTLALLGDEDLRKQLGSNGRRDALARFSIERFMTEILSLYRGVLQSGKMPQRENAQVVETRRVAPASRP